MTGDHERDGHTRHLAFTRAGRPLWWTVGLSLSLLAAVGVLVWVSVDSDPYVAPEPGTASSTVQPAAAASALQDLQDAVDAGDSAVAVALAPADDGVARSQLQALVENSEALGVAEFTLRYVDEAGGMAEDSWTAAVDVTWLFSGFDPTTSRAEVLVRFTNLGDRVAISEIGGGDRRTPIWMDGPVSSRRTSQTLVLVAGPSKRLGAYQRQAETAIAQVRPVLSSWRPRLVVEVPATAADLDRALDADPGEYANIAAVTTSTDGTLLPDSPVHVFVNPAVFERLDRVGAQVVMTHEAVHVATVAPSSATPLWLLEGFADYVALRKVDLPLSVTAGQAIRQVRREGPPAQLPTATEFDRADTKLGAAYESAWLACRVLEERGGEQALVSFYRRLDVGAGLGPQLRQRFSWSQREFVTAWRQRLAGLAA